MQDLLIYGALSLIGGFSGVIGAYVVVKRTLDARRIIEKLDEVLLELKESPETQQKLFTLGAILGAGLKQGIGLGKGGSKQSLESLGVDLIKSFLFGGMGGQQPAQTSPGAPGTNPMEMS